MDAHVILSSIKNIKFKSAMEQQSRYFVVFTLYDQTNLDYQGVNNNVDKKFT
jgi:hypothetical protein